MPSIRDIINAATPGPWEPEHDEHKIWDSSVVDANSKLIASFGDDAALSREDAEFISMANPTHFSLMMLEINASRELVDSITAKDSLRIGSARTWHSFTREALDTYRKERGLDG